MIDPFDSEFLSQELRDAWKKIEELEKENKELQEENEKLKEENEALEDIMQEEINYELEQWNREQYGDY